MASAIDRRFQIAEQNLRRKELQREQQEKEGLKRKFASIGGLGSGASIKAELAAGEAASRRMSEGKQQIEVAKLGEQARQEEIAANRAFQTSERLGGQGFAEPLCSIPGQGGLPGRDQSAGGHGRGCCAGTGCQDEFR